MDNHSRENSGDYLSGNRQFANGEAPVAYKILVVDDDAAIQRLYTAILETEGYDSIVADDGEQGLRMVYQEHPDLIISDLDMPRMNGYEFCKLVRIMDDIPILMISGSGEQVERMIVVRLLGDTIDVFLPKPIGLQELLTEVAIALDRGKNEGVPAQ